MQLFDKNSPSQQASVDNTPVELSPAQREELHLATVSLAGVLSTLVNILGTSAAIPKGFMRNLVMVAHSRIKEIAAAARIPELAPGERDELTSRVRAANMRVRELEAALGGKVSGEETLQAIRQVASRLRLWWSMEGFGHINEIVFLDNGIVRATLCCSLLSVPHRLRRAHPDKTSGEVEAMWREKMRQKNFLLDGSELVDCEPSRQALRNLVATIPSAEIESTLSYQLNIREAVVLFRDLDVLLALPAEGATGA